MAAAVQGGGAAAAQRAKRGTAPPRAAAEGGGAAPRRPSATPPAPSGGATGRPAAPPGRPPAAPASAPAPARASSARSGPRGRALAEAAVPVGAAPRGARSCSLPPLRDARRGPPEAAPRGPRARPGEPAEAKTRREAAKATDPAQATPSSSSCPPRPKKQASGRRELDEWRRRRGVAPEARVFSVSGAFPDVRAALLARGWVENEERGSPVWEFKYALLQRDIGEISELADDQVINYFSRNSELTSKAGLNNTLYSCCALDRVDIDSFYPRCYDLTSTTQVDQFVQDFKATRCLSLLRMFISTGGRTREGGNTAGYPSEVIAAALDVCRRRAAEVDDTLDEAPRPVLDDGAWQVVGDWSLKRPGRRMRPWKGKRPEQPAASAAAAPSPAAADAARDEGAADEGAASDASEEAADGAADEGAALPARSREDEALCAAAGEVVDALRARLPQFGLEGMQDIWVLKPAGKSRGRGIQLSARLEKILEVGVGRGAEARWMAQKYIENPLIVRGKKFDIRQWVVVTRWQPLAVWFYNDCYLRFSFSDYDPSKIKNKYAHLTNNSISKKAKGFDDRVDETMWHSDEFCEFLKTIGFSKDGHPVEDPWAEVVQPAMKRVVMTTMQCAQDVVQPRTNSFELFGYDFMVDDDLGVWLIEVNSSPDLSYSTSTTEGLVKAMLEDMMRVVVDVEKFGVRPDRPRRKWGSCRTASGRYELLEPRLRRREERFRRVAKDTGTLAVQGCAVQLRRPRRGECPRGPDVEDDPRYSAASLLAAAGVEEGAGPEGGGGGPEAGDSDSASSEG